MAYYYGELSSYTLQYRSGGAAATIVCVTVSSGVLYLRFERGDVLTANSTNVIASGTRQFYMSYPYDQLPVVVDLLRNEKPVTFWFRDDSMHGGLTTSAEPPGEAEGV